MAQPTFTICLYPQKVKQKKMQFFYKSMLRKKMAFFDYKIMFAGHTFIVMDISANLSKTSKGKGLITSQNCVNLMN